VNCGFINTVTIPVFQVELQIPQEGLVIQWLDGATYHDAADPANIDRLKDRSVYGNYGLINKDTGDVNLNPTGNPALRWPNAFLTRAEVAALQNSDEDFVARASAMLIRVLAYPTGTDFGNYDDTASGLFYVRRYPLLDQNQDYLLDDDNKIIYSGGLIYQ
jgi:hypothetical protein